MRVRSLRVAGIGALCAALAGCVVDSSIPSGMSGTLNAANVRQASANLHSVLRALKADAGIDGDGTTSWYETTVAGFNFVDGQCVDYFNELFFLERRRKAVSSAFSSFGQTTSAILFATSASQISMAVVAQAFGLAQQLTDIVADSFLYKLPPATTMNFVRELQSAYRIGAAKKKYDINTPSDAYHEIQSYLELCLPPTIEARLVGHISGAKAVPITADGDTKIVVGSDVSAEDKARAALVEPLGANDPIKPTPPSEGPEVNKFLAQSVRLTADEKAMLPGEPAAIQRAICVTPDDGVFGESTRTGIGLAKRGVIFYQDGVVKETTDTLNETMIEFFLKQSSCVNHEAGYRTGFEKYGYPDANSIGSFQNSLKTCHTVIGQKTSPGFTSDLAITGVIDAKTREVISDVRQGLNLESSDMITPGFQFELSKCLD